MEALEVVGIKKSFGRVRVLDDISFKAGEGEFVVMLGPSGCGKTTMLRIIAGLEVQDEGYIYIGGKEVTNLNPKLRDVAMVFQSYALYPHMTVYENMAFPLKMRKLNREEIKQKVRQTAELLRIDDLLDRKPRELSGGQRQRVAIGRAIVRSPKVFLFDEPLSNLDAQLRASMRVELRRLHEKIGSTSIYVTHDQIEAMTLADKIILLENGVIQQIGTPEEIYKKPANLFVATFVGTPMINLLDGTLILKDGVPLFKSGEFEIALPSFKEYFALDGKPVVLGIRPEAVTIGKGPYRATVRQIEHLGSEKIIYLELKGKDLVAKTHGPAETDRAVCFDFNEDGLHLFYGRERIERIEEG
ncbi:MAG: ABC transporter ATP-binding protein [Nitrospirae bacterium]|nr:ABC transporter ATP-binding protein [Nitrospirota bacterium]